VDTLHVAAPRSAITAVVELLLLRRVSLNEKHTDS